MLSRGSLSLAVALLNQRGCKEDDVAAEAAERCQVVVNDDDGTASRRTSPLGFGVTRIVRRGKFLAGKDCDAQL